MLVWRIAIAFSPQQQPAQGAKRTVSHCPAPARLDRRTPGYPSILARGENKQGRPDRVTWQISCLSAAYADGVCDAP
jgi:hypothetical protein